MSLRYVWRATVVVRAMAVDRLAAAPPGAAVRVSGTVERDGDPIVAPFSGDECVALRYSVEERRLGALFVLPWYVTVHTDTASVPFALRTAAGSVPVVEPARTVTLANRVVATSDSGGDAPEPVRRFEREHDSVPESTVWRDPPAGLGPLFRVLSLGRRRYAEQRAAVGDEVTAVGRVTDDGDGVDPLVVSDRSPAGTVLRMARTSIGGLAIGLVGVALGAALLVL